MKRILLFIFFCAVLCLAGCSTLDSRTQDLKLGMTKEQTVKQLGKDYRTVGARQSSTDGAVEVIKYVDGDFGDLFLYFRDGKLVQWGDTKVMDDIPY